MAPGINNLYKIIGNNSRKGLDTPIPGYMIFNTIALRPWSSNPANEFNFSKFNEGDYFQSL